MNRTDALSGDARSNLVGALPVAAFAVPGALFAALVLTDAVFDIRPLSSSRVLGNIASLVVTGGILSAVTTPVALIFGWIMRKRLSGAAGTTAKVLLAIAAFGWIALILKYANPFFTGS